MALKAFVIVSFSLSKILITLLISFLLEIFSGSRLSRLKSRVPNSTSRFSLKVSGQIFSNPLAVVVPRRKDRSSLEISRGPLILLTNSGDGDYLPLSISEIYPWVKPIIFASSFCLSRFFFLNSLIFWPGCIEKVFYDKKCLTNI